MSERDKFEDWLRLGIRKGWISEVCCETHDGLPWTETEMEEWESGWDPCMPAVRVWGLENVL